MKKIGLYIFMIILLIFAGNIFFYSDTAGTDEKIMSRAEYMVLAREYVARHEHDKLNKLMADMLEKYPNDPDTLCHIGILLFYENPDEAEKIFKNIIEIDLSLLC